MKKGNFTIRTSSSFRELLLVFLGVSMSFFVVAQDMVTISGILQMEDGGPLPNVMIDVNDGMYVTYTDEEGYYSLTVPAGGDYTIRPIKEDEVALGVSMYDVILLTWHIIGIVPLETPFKYLAGDANNSEYISTMDIVAIRSVILGMAEEFPNKKPWYFFYVGDGSLDPFSEVAVLKNLTEDISWADFVVVKTGDLNDSAVNFSGEAVEAYDEGGLIIQIEDRYITEGETFTVDFVVQEGKVMGYQFTIDFESSILDLEGLIPGVSGEDNFGTQWVSDGVLTTAWGSSDVQDLGNRALFSLVFKSAGNGWLSDFLNISSSYTAAEAYTGDGETVPVLLYAKPFDAGDDFVLYANHPNPFVDATQISFNLPEGGKVKLTILDASGKVVYEEEGVYSKGYHSIQLSGIQAKGLLSCRLETEYEVVTQKMLSY